MNNVSKQHHLLVLQQIHQPKPTKSQPKSSIHLYFFFPIKNPLLSQKIPNFSYTQTLVLTQKMASTINHSNFTQLSCHSKWVSQLALDDDVDGYD